MGRKKLSKKLQEMKNAEEAYAKVDILLHLSSMQTVAEKVRACVFAANDVLTEICQNADKIKIDMFDEVSTIIDIDKPRWKEFANLAYKVANGSIQDDIFEKNNEKIHESLYILNLRKSFYDTYVAGTGEAVLVHKDAVEDLSKMDDTFTSSDFENLLTDAVNVRHYLNTILWPTFKNFGLAALHVTHGELDYKKFKMLVDWEHYKNGGYPSPKSKPKLWSIYDKFDVAYRLMDKYGFSQITDLNRQFGLDVSLKEPSATRNTFSESSKILSKYEIVRPICEDSRIKMKMLEDEVGIFLSPSHFAIYDSSTRVIRRIMNYSTYLTEINNPSEKLFTTKGVKDSFDYLVLDDVSYPLYRELITTLCCEDVIHPDGRTKPNHSLRFLTQDDISLLGKEGYYGNGTNPSQEQLPNSQNSNGYEDMENVSGNADEETERTSDI